MARSIQSTDSYDMIFISTLKLSRHLHHGFPSGLFPSCFRTNISWACIKYIAFIWNRPAGTDTSANVHLPLFRSFSITQPTPWFRLTFHQTEGFHTTSFYHDTILRNHTTSVPPTPDEAQPAVSAHISLWNRDSVLYSISINSHSRYFATDWRTFGGTASGFVVVEIR